MDSKKKNQLRIGSCNVCGFATEERQRLEKDEQVSKRDVDLVGIKESWEKERGEIGRRVGEYAWTGKKLSLIHI